MAYIAQIHRPSSVRHALLLKFLDPEDDCLVVAKANRLEFYEHGSDGLSLKHARSIYGKVTMLQRLHPANAETDHLFVGTDRHTYFVVSWSSADKQLRTERSYVDQSDAIGRDSQSLDRCHVDPTGRFLTMELFEGIITAVPISQKYKKKGDVPAGSLGEPIPIRIPELFVRSTAFCHRRGPTPEKEPPRLALLYEDSHEEVRLKIRTLGSDGLDDPTSADLEVENHVSDQLGVGSSHLIPLPEPAFGLLILAETSIMHFDDDSGAITAQPLESATIFATWAQVDSQRWLLADDFGNLYMLMIMLDHDALVKWKLDVLGQTSTATCLVYLDAGYVFVGSHQGDSQVVKIGNGTLDIIQSISNIAPILDFSIMDMGSREGDGQTNEYSSGQSRIVTGSGAFRDGSLRSVRSGVGLEDLGTLGEMENITDIFSLRSSDQASFSDTLVVSFLAETRIFVFGTEGEVEEKESFAGFNLSQGTLLAMNTAAGHLLQATPLAVTLSDADSGMVLSSWEAPIAAGIVAVSANSTHVALSLGGVELVILDLSNNLRVTSRRVFPEDSQISCVTVPSVVLGICIVGFWQHASISILQMETLEASSNQALEELESIPRYILLASMIPEQPPTLFVSLADGHVVTFSFDPNTYVLSQKKSVVLGTQQVKFQELPRDEHSSNVFATCEHPSLIYGSEGRIVYSAVTAEKATSVCAFDTEAFPGSIAIATPSDLRIALIDTERTTHVQSLPVGETVRRIAYSTKEKVFGMGTIQRNLVDGAEVIQSHFKLVDEVVFKELDTYKLKEDELVESVMQAELDDGHGLAERFIIGTAYLMEDSKTERGRIIVFDVTPERTLKMVTSLAVRGACRTLAMVDDRIVAGLVKTVVILAFWDGELNRRASYRTATAPIDIAVTGNTIALADIMKSVSILEYRRGTEGSPDTLHEIARHFRVGWCTAVAVVDEHTFLESDAEGNLVVLRQNINGVTDDDMRRLEVTSEMLLGEMVNKIKRVNVPTHANATVVPRAFMATVEGSLYLFALISQSKQDLLMRLQAQVASLVQSPGGMPFMKYRAFKTAVRQAEEPYRFVDGELIEQFLDCSPEMQEHIVKDLKADLEEVRTMVEELRRIH